MDFYNQGGFYNKGFDLPQGAQAEDRLKPARNIVQCYSVTSLYFITCTYRYWLVACLDGQLGYYSFRLPSVPFLSSDPTLSDCPSMA